MRTSILALLLAASAFGQVGEVSLSMGSSRFRNNTIIAGSEANSNFHLSARLTINQWRFFGHELGYGYNHGSLTDNGADYGMSTHQGFYDFLAYATPEGARVRPFAAGGVHFSSFFPPGASVGSGNGITKFGYNYGAGVKVKMTSSFLFRVDVRDYATGKPDIFGIGTTGGMLRQLVVSAGVGYTF